MRRRPALLEGSKLPKDKAVASYPHSKAFGVYRRSSAANRVLEDSYWKSHLRHPSNLCHLCSRYRTDGTDGTYELQSKPFILSILVDYEPSFGKNSSSSF